MKKEVLFAVFLFAVLIISACEQIDISKLSDEDLGRIAKEVIVCDKPYIRHETGCCLDQNDNKICDRDERELTAIEKIKEKNVNRRVETPSEIKPPVEETPAEPITPAQETVEEAIPDTFLPSKCTLPAGIACIDHLANTRTDTITLVLRNGMGFDAASVVVTVDGCGTAISSGDEVLSNGERETYIATCTSLIPGSEITKEFSVQYTNADTGLKHKIIGNLLTSVELGDSITTTPPTQETVEEAVIEGSGDSKPQTVPGSISEGFTKTYSISGKDFEVSLINIQVNSASLSINGEIFSLSDSSKEFILSDGTKVTYISINPSVYFLLDHGTDNFPIGTFEEQETDTYHLSNNRDYEITAISVSSNQAKFSVNGEKSTNLQKDESHTFSDGLILEVFDFKYRFNFELTS